MKKIIFLVALFATSFFTTAQIKTPAPSPSGKLEQKVGLTDVTLEYSRPSMKGRTIFGDLVPYDKVWRTGANANTKITFSDDVTIDGKSLPAGTYAIYTKPHAEKWEIMFYTDSDNSGTPEKWDDSKVALSTSAPVIKMPMNIETFTMTVDNITNNSAVLGMLWENAYVGLEFEVPTEKTVMMSIEETMKGEPTGDDYYAAAVYYLQQDKDIKQAKEWIDKAVKMDKKPAFWKLRQQSLIYAKAGDKKEAIEIAKHSMALAEEAGNADFVKMNKDSLKEWGAK